jgi:CheY-like chemotaxis protein
MGGVLRGRVLVMDDDSAVRDVARTILEHLECEVTVAADGNEAIALYGQAFKAGRPFDLVILDLSVRGGMGGEETLREMLKIDPKVKAVLSSGFSSDPVVTEYHRHGFAGLMPKPYRIREVESVLQGFLPSGP